MNHPFRLGWWSKRRALLLVVLLALSGPSLADPASLVGEILGWIVIVWVLVAFVGAATGLLPGSKDPEGA